eukprot:213590-Hanusia_phi.AAC.1
MGKHNVSHESWEPEVCTAGSVLVIVGRRHQASSPAWGRRPCPGCSVAQPGASLHIFLRRKPR